MGFILTGYVLEPPRVGQANSPFTNTPNIKTPDPAAFNAHYPTNESAPRNDYLVFPRVDGDLPDVLFCWTKNEIIARFDYEGKNQRFKPLPGKPPIVIGQVAADLNTNRLKVTAPLTTDFTNYPVRLSVGTGSGTTLTLVVVANEAAFTTPPAGTVQVAQDTGTLNWHPSDLVTFFAQDVRFQRQSFFTYDESKGNLDVIDNILLLNPIPGPGQFPLIRIGFSEYLTPIERATEGGFSSNPAAGTVEWARSTGRLKFHAGDVTANSGKTVYYDGSCFAFSLQLIPTSHGTVNFPGFFTPIPDVNADTFFRVPGVVQFADVEFVDDLDPLGVQGTVQIRNSDGAILFSLADRAAYGFFAVQAYVPDLPIERGMALRLRRTPVDPEALDPDLKDMTAYYVSTDAVLADPIIGSPKVLLPAVPDESQPIVVNVGQGTGTFVGELPRLDVLSPPPGLGYIIDFPAQELHFARRKEDVVFPQSAKKPYGTVALSDSTIVSDNLLLELETSPGSNVFAPLTLNEDVTFDFNAGVAKLVTTVGEVLATSSVGSFSGTTFTDTSNNFLTDGVSSDDLLVVLSGASEGVYTITAVTAHTVTTDLPGTTGNDILYEVHHGREILADRFFKTAPALDPNTKVERLNIIGTSTNSPRLNIEADRVAVSRFRLGKTTFLTTVQVANDGAFTSPPQGTVQVSEATGNLNFNTADFGQTVYWALTLTLITDYRVQPQLGFIDFNDRLLQSEEVFVTYAVLDSSNNKVIVQERATFAVRKEVTVHPAVTSTIPFNPLGREVATTPPARVFRGGRPQVTGQQVSIDYTASTVTFLPDKLKDNTVPHGQTVQPSERIYVDYSIYEAIGGEKNITVSQPPMLGVTIVINDGESSFLIPGDRTLEFPQNHLLKVDKTEVYLLDSPTYDSAADVTTVNIQAPQVFRSDFQGPPLHVTSGKTRVVANLSLPSYFVTELTSYETVARGANAMKFVGDVSKTYVGGTVVFWTNGSDIFDFNVVEGSTYDTTTNRTAISFTANGAKQYKSSLVTLKRSSNPILSSAVAAVSTFRSPDLTLPFLVFRRVEGQVGVVSQQPDDYSIDNGGRVVFTKPLQDNEALVICYTGARVIDDGRDFRASYTHLVIPDSVNNGMAGQVLTMDYTAYLPDSFYWRVETITTFRAELAQQYGDDAQSNIPSGGPRLQNSSGPKLFKQGRESLFFNEEHLANEDFVARYTLKYYNDGVNYMEDALQSLDGRIVGGQNGRFLFDGNIDNPLRFSLLDVTNQIDDLLQVAIGPVTITFPPFAVSFLGTFREMYRVGRFSRFYPTRRHLYGVAADSTGFQNEDPILDTGFGGWAAVDFIFRRQPWAVVTKPALAGDTTIHVDNADGALELLRPAFDPSTYDHTVAVITQDGFEIVTPFFPLVVASKTTTSLTFTTPLPVDVPYGATVFQTLLNPNPFPSGFRPYPLFYRSGYDVGGDEDNGTIDYIDPFPPFDGSDTDIPASLLAKTPAGGEILDVHVQLFNKITEPYRIPALDGGTHDDDNNRTFPILTPSLESEGGVNIGYVYVEDAIVHNPGGTLRTATTSPLVSTGNLDATKTIISNIPGGWPLPTPKIDDLVEIRTGSNALSGYHRITAVGASTLTVTDPFASVDSGFTFTVTVSNTLVTGAAGTFTTTTLTDGTANFTTAGVQPGHTVVVTSGANSGLRRQVTQVNSATVLTITSLPSGGVASYRVDNPLGTFGGTPSILDDLLAALLGELNNLDSNARPATPYSERQGIELFFSQFFNTITTGTTGQTFGSAQLHDASATFIASGVIPGQFVYIRSGTQAGIYKVDTVSSGTNLNITQTFPGSASGITYSIVKSELPLKALQDAFSVLAKVDQAIADVNTFYTLETTVVPVVSDAGAFGRRTLTSDLNARATQVSARIADLTDLGTGSPVVLSSVLASTGKLYDKRYVWIDARTNLEKGILPKKQQALDSRLKAEEDIRRQLIKLLTAGAT